MPNDRGVPAACPDAALRALADALAPHLVRFLAPEAPDDVSYFSQYDSPLGRKRHLVLARTGELRGYRVGRLVLVRREAVRDFIERAPAALPGDHGYGNPDSVGFAVRNERKSVSKPDQNAVKTASKPGVGAAGGPNLERNATKVGQKSGVESVARSNATSRSDDELADWGLVRRGAK